LLISNGEAFILIISDAPFLTCSSAGPLLIQISSQILIPTAISSYQNISSGFVPFAKYLASSKTE